MVDRRLRSALARGLMMLPLLVAFLPAATLAQQAPASAPPKIAPPPRAVQLRIYELLRLGKIAYSRKEYEDALTYFNAILELDPTFPEAHFRIGTIYVQQKQYDKAIRAIERSLKESPGNIPVMFSLASVYKLANKMDKAMEIYRTIMEQAHHPRHKAQAKQRLEQIEEMLARKKRAEEEALRKLEAAVEANPEDVKLLVKLAERYLKREEFDKARQTYQRILEIESHHPIARLRLAELAHKEKEDEAAFEHLTVLLQHYPGGITGQAAIDLTLKLTSKPANANSEASGKLLELAIRAVPNNIAVNTSLGIYHQLAKEFEKAEEYFKRVIELEPDNALAHANLASVYVDMGRPGDAIAELEKVINLEDQGDIPPKTRKALVALYIKLGTALIKTGEMAQGHKAFDYALSADPENPDILAEVAEAYFSINALPYATKYFEQAAEIDPDNPKINYYLGIIYDESGELDKAIEAYSKLVGVKTASKKMTAEEMAHKLALLIAKKAFNEGRLDQAEEILTNTVQQRPDDFVAHFYLALIYENTNRRELAVKEYEEAVRINPNHSGARLQLGYLYEQMWLEEDALAQYSMVSRLGNNQFMERAERAQLALSKKINGFGYSLTQSLTFDTNSNLDQYNPQFGYRSSISFNATYRYKISPNVRFRLQLGPSYQGYITRSSDVFNLSINPTLTLGNGNEGVELSYRFSDASGFLNEETKISQTHYYSAKIRTQIEPLWQFAPPKNKHARPDPWSLSTTFSYRAYESVTNPLFSAHTYKAQFSLSMRTPGGYGINLGYDYSKNLNENDAGSDNAYARHGLNAGISFAIVPGWMGSLSYSLAYTGYLHPDSVSPEGTKRRSLTNVVSLSVSHAISRQVRVFAGYNWTYNRANLPINIDLNDVERISQSASLGDYSSQTLTIGLGLSF